ncbi:MAG: type III-A CRISPR-associated protein Csm2 [Anaerolineae bacterium]|nr:type III-A CRISPR-associated protein Csm2 [Anaerolineae bacterium]
MGYRPPQTKPGASGRPNFPDLRRIIQGTDVDSTRQLVKTAQEWGEHLARQKLTTSQIRTIFGLVRLIELSWPSDINDPERARRAERDLILLKPKLAYQAQRDADKNKQTQPVRQLEELLSPAIDLVQGDRDNFQRFVDFFEAVLAYHKAAGGGER